MSAKQGEWSRIGVNSGGLRGNGWGIAWGMNPDLDEMPQLYETLKGWKSVCRRAYNLKGIKGEIFCFSSFLSFVSLLLWLISWRADPAVAGGGDRLIN